MPVPAQPMCPPETRVTVNYTVSWAWNIFICCFLLCFFVQLGGVLRVFVLVLFVRDCVCVCFLGSGQLVVLGWTLVVVCCLVLLRKA